jgi:hypothetical protein
MFLFSHSDIERSRIAMHRQSQATTVGSPTRDHKNTGKEWRYRAINHVYNRSYRGKEDHSCQKAQSRV